MFMVEISNETQLQSFFWEWAWNTYPQFRRMMWAVPNGASRSRYEAQVAKATGLLSGVWDLHAYPPGGPLHIIECKWGTNTLSVDRVVGGKKIYGQKEWGDIMAANGAQRYICYDLPACQTAYRDIFGLPAS